jgi:GNAT superfamily N-acetyltransferase
VVKEMSGNEGEVEGATQQAGGRVSLRPAAPEDSEFLINVYAASRADEMALVDWTDEQKLAFLTSQFNSQREQYLNRFPDSVCSVINFGGERVGRLWVARLPEQIRLLDIALLPQHQNKGVGGQLMRALIEESEATALPLRHMVFKLNPGGWRFYERLGFEPIEEYHMYIHLERRPASAQKPTSASG